MSQSQIIVKIIFDVLICAVMILASIDDVKTRKVRPVFQIVLAVLAVAHLIYTFIAVGASSGLYLLAAGALLFVVYFAIYEIFKGGIGGADFKVSTTLALYLGVIPAVVMVIGHTLAGLCYKYYMKLVHHKYIERVALMPFLLAGFIIADALDWVTKLV